MLALETRLSHLLIDEGYEDLTSVQTTRSVIRFVTGQLGSLAADLPEFLDIVGSLARPVELTLSQQRRLNEFADFCETLDLNRSSAWPWRGAPEDRRGLTELALRLGGFPREIVAEQARIADKLIKQVGGRAPFWFLFDGAGKAELSLWDNIEDLDAACDLLVRLFFAEEGTAFVAARALRTYPEKQRGREAVAAVIPLLPPNIRRIAAHTALALDACRGQRARKWCSAPDPVLRHVAAEGLALLTDDGTSTAEARKLVADEDAGVRQTVVDRLRKQIGDEGKPGALALLERAARQAPTGWLCHFCGATNLAGLSSCERCNVVAPQPESKASAFWRISIRGLTRSPVLMTLSLNCCRAHGSLTHNRRRRLSVSSAPGKRCGCRLADRAVAT
ncbi:MAG: HEAT repeat domain-containing protein [Egibacteraceae bacterium]